MRSMNPRGIPLPTVRRLPFYLRLFREEADKGTLWLSSDFLGDRLSLGAIQVRKDLSMVGAEGRARCGFPVQNTIEVLSSFLGGDDYADVFLVGSGPLAEAILFDGTLFRHGFNVIAVFDSNPVRIGMDCHGHDILPMNKFPDLVRRMNIRLAVFAISDPEDATNALTAMGDSQIAGVCDLSGLSLAFPSDVIVDRDDIGSRLAKIASELGAGRIALRSGISE